MAIAAAETDSSSHGVRTINYPTTAGTSTMQQSRSIQDPDPQARTHMLAERRRRVKEKEHYAILRKLIPPTSRVDKAAVLAETIQLVTGLKGQVRQLERVNRDSGGSSNLSFVAGEDSQICASLTSGGDIGTASLNCGGHRLSERELQEGKFPGSDPDFVSRGTTTLLLDERKEVVEVTAQSRDQKILEVKIRTFHLPDTMIHIVTCLNDFGLQVLFTDIRIRKGWIHADFQLLISAVHSFLISQFYGRAAKSTPSSCRSCKVLLGPSCRTMITCMR
ncbi:hypothetical protein R1flu_009906 [Riccia fluitans]|uniref:BHLH domain-containing protein n=1 Tax=Riccia fluitans TaxID=41844 RepID=A0ABD1Z622_9MARC